MRLLLDTHVFIWWDDDYTILPDKVFEAISNPENLIFLSLASVWEMQIKLQLGKLKFDVPLPKKLQAHTRKNGLKFLPIGKHHIFAINDLPLHHRDPFDRIIIAQARTDGLVLVSHDSEVRRYDVPIFWD